MKKIIVSVGVMLLMSSCLKDLIEKFDKEDDDDGDEVENHCPVVDSSLVPAAVLAGFQAKYPKEIALMWFKKGSIGYCAYFVQSASEHKLTEFKTDGSFVSEELDVDQDGEFEDSADNEIKGAPETCDCEIPD